MILSIIIPVYNVEKYIEKCIRSCEAQDISTTEYEIIIVNDGSKDKSLEIIERVVDDYNNIIVINQSNQGLSGARNTGMRNAHGDYYMFVDSDDWIAENCLSKLIQKLEREKPDCLAMCACNVINDKFVRRQSYLNENTMTGVELLMHGVSPCAPFSIWNSSFLKDNNLCFYEGIFHEDVEFTTKAYYLAKKISLINDIIYFVYQNPNSITRTSNPKRSYDLINVVNTQLSSFMKNVKKEHLVIFHNRISLNINNALNNIMSADKKDLDNLNLLFYKNKSFFKHMIKSSILKYKVEGVLFYMFPKRTCQIYNFLSKIKF